MQRIRFLILLVCFTLLTHAGHAQNSIFQSFFNTDSLYLYFTVLDDDLIHFELSSTPIESGFPLSTSVMIAKTDYEYAGASSVEFPAENEIATPEMHIQIDPANLCATITDRIRDFVLTTICPSLAEGAIKGLTFTKEGTTDLYGLGEQFRRRIGTDGDWMDSRRIPANRYGNSLMSFEGGNVGNVQIPVLYALGEGTNNYAVFVDSVYQQAWTFTDDPFALQIGNLPDDGQLHWYVMTGSDLPDLRSDYMELTGTPPVPPKQMFGLWVSEYGYENWQELETVLESLKSAGFPLDGFVLDLQWFGGIGGANSQMGSLAWDEENFPDPAAYIAALREQYGVGIMTIEEPYVAVTARGYAEAAEANALVTECPDCEPIYLTSWWGAGSMVDWTHPNAAAWWHTHRRQHLIDAGVIGHWTDLGEPEDYKPAALYDMGDHASVHNLYNLMWTQSIWENYGQNDVARRPFILSRSGTAGSQRYGAALWSGDIAANLQSLAAQQNVQMHMALSGIDYFGSDIGGFFRLATDPLLQNNGVYTLWIANSALTDVPVRPHAMSLQNQFPTAPSLIGDVPSNLANVRMRYELSPYLYSLAHQAYRTGEAVFPPLVYHFQTDPAVRDIGSQKMIGSQMMMATLTDTDPETTDVYLPAGGWFNFRTMEYIQSEGETVTVTGNELIQAPLSVRDGAIIPMMNLEDDTLNILGQRTDGTFDHTLILNLYHADADGSFTLIEDDGETMAYQSGAVRETTITQTANGDDLTITISAANGTYDGAPDEREIRIRLFAHDRVFANALVNGESLPELSMGEGERGWMRLSTGMYFIKLGVVPADTTLTITLQAAPPAPTEPPATEAAVTSTPTAQTASERPLLLAHYMPWYQTPDVSGYWGWHWTMNHFNPRQVDANGRREIASQFMPLTDVYDSQDEAILEYQVLLMKLSGIDGVIVDWYGTANYNDYATLNAATGKLFEAVKRAGLRFVICYEDRTVMTMVNDGRLNTQTALEQGRRDLQYAAEQWMRDPAYVTYQRQPLVFVFGPLYFRQLSDWTTIFDGIEPAPALVTLDNSLSFGSLSNYPWPPMSMSGGIELAPAALDSYLERFYRNARRRDLIVGSAFPAFLDIYAQAGVRSSYGSINPRDGETLRHTLDLALAANANIIQLVTWNDYGEGTTIEPTEEYSYQYLEIVQDTRRTLESDFAPTADDLRLPMRLLERRRAHAGDDAINAELDRAFDAIIAGDTSSAASILDALE